MTLISRLLAVLLLAVASPAFGQIPNYPQTLPPDSFVGNIKPGPAPTQAVPIASLLARVLTPNGISNSILFKAPAATIKGNPTAATANVRDFTIQGLPARGAPDANNDKLLIFDVASGTFKYVTPGLIAASATSGVSSLDGVTGSLTAQPGSLKVVGGQLSSNTLPSRAFAMTQNLSAFSAIQTLGYTTPADGGRATFKNVGAVPFTDTYVTAATVNGGSGYTDGAYPGVPFTGGSGHGCEGSVTVSGGAATPSIVVPCAGYIVGDVLSTPNSFIGNTGSGFTYTVTAISGPAASFIDAGGLHWQYAPDGTPNVLQFGCKADWALDDAIATNNLVCLQTAAAWASKENGPVAASGVGRTVYIPAGAYMACGSFNGTPYVLALPQGVGFDGAGVLSSKLVECAANSPGNHFIELCDSNAGVSQFGCKVSNMALVSTYILTATSGFAVLYSKSGTQFTLAENVEIQAGLKSCIKYDTGTGGGPNDIWLRIDCSQLAATNPAFNFDAGTAQHVLLHSVCASSGVSALCVQNSNGRLLVDGLDVEGYVTGLVQAVSTVSNNGSYKNVQHNSNGCTQAILLVFGNTPGNLLMENVATGCPTTITNGQPGGSPLTGNIVKQITCVSGACN